MALEIATAKACKERFQQLDEEANALEVEIAQRLKSGIRRALAVRCVGEDARNKGKESQANALPKTVGKGAVSITGAPGTASSKGYVPAAVSTGTQEASPKPIMRRIDEVVRAVTPIIESEHPAGPIYKLDEAAMKLHAIDARELSALNVQMRLAGGYREQQREIGRLVGYAHAFPARMTVIAPSPTGTLFTGVRLPRNAPPELQSLANKYAHHQPAQQQLADAIYERNRKSSEDGLSAHSPPQRPIAAPRMMGKVPHAGPIMNGRSVLAADEGEPSSGLSSSAPVHEQVEAEHKLVLLESETPPKDRAPPSAAQECNTAEGGLPETSDRANAPTRDDGSSDARNDTSEASKPAVDRTSTVPAKTSQVRGPEFLRAEPTPAALGGPASATEPPLLNSLLITAAPISSGQIGTGPETEKATLAAQRETLIDTTEPDGEVKGPKFNETGTTAPKTTGTLPTEKAEVRLNAGGSRSADADLALSDLAARTKQRLGPKWPQFQEDLKRFGKLTQGPEKERLAYTINGRLEVQMSDRYKYPRLSTIFENSDRNFASLQKAVEAQKTIQWK